MLCLSRRPNERINVYQNTAAGKRLLGSVLLMEVRGEKCRLGFEFAKDVSFVRDEIDERPGQKPTDGAAA